MSKIERLRGALARHPDLRDLSVAPLRLAQPEIGYRTRAKLAVAHDPLRIGLYAPGTHDVVDGSPFEMLRPALRETLDALRAVATAHAKHPAVRALAALDLRETLADPGDPRVLLTWIVRAPARGRAPAVDDALARAICAACPRVVTLAESVQPPGSPQLLGRDRRILRGPPLVRDRLCPDTPWFFAAPGAFIQSHRPQAAAITRALVEGPGRPGPSTTCLELFGGSGALSLALAAQGARVTMVESFPEAVDAARAAAAEQSLPVEAIAGDAATEARRLARDGARFDAVVVNPPRRGLDPEVRAAVAALEPATIAYVSCSPETLARDLDHLLRLGYAPRSLEPFDMIPGTSEVETLAFLARAAIPLPRVIYEDEELVAVDKPPHEPTTPHGEHATSLLARVQRLPNAREAVPIHRLDHGTSGVCLFARRADHAGAWAAALGAGDAEKVYIAAVRGRVRDKGTINRALEERGAKKEARTRYRRTEIIGGHHSLLEVRPDHGRKHQIRRHLASIGHPILGDDRYGHAPTNQFVHARWGLDRPFLHCAQIALRHPKTGARLDLVAELASDLVAVLAASVS